LIHPSQPLYLDVEGATRKAGVMILL